MIPAALVLIPRHKPAAVADLGFSETSSPSDADGVQLGCARGGCGSQPDVPARDG